MRQIKSAVKSFVFTLIPHFLPSWNTALPSRNVCVSTVVGHRYIPYLIYTLQSLFASLGMALPVYIINDGSLNRSDIKLMKRLFHVTIMEKSVADAQMKHLIGKHSNFFAYRFRENSCILRYVFDALLLPPYERVIFLESDILFHRTPIEIKKWIMNDEKITLCMKHDWSRVKKNMVQDIYHSFRVLLHGVWKDDYILGLNGGLICLGNKLALNFDTLDQISKIFNVLDYSRDWSSFESAIMLLFGRKYYLRILPQRKYLVAPFMLDYETGFDSTVTCVHYTCESKSKFMKDAILLILKTKFFRKI